MRVVISGIIASIVLGVVAAFVLGAVQQPAYEVFATSSTRLSEPGSNLVGEAWSGNPKVETHGS